MPCRDYYSDEWNDPKSSYEYRHLKSRADMLARIACKAMTALEELGQEDFLLLKDEEVRMWWTDHKEADRKEREAEEQKKRLIRTKEEALAKLSEEELEILGLKRKVKKAK